MRPAFLAATLALLAAQIPAGATERKFGAWTLDDEGGLCVALVDTGPGASLALVLRPGGEPSFAIVGPQVPAAEVNSTATLRVTFDESKPVDLPARASRRDSQTGYIVPYPGLPAVLDEYPARLKLGVTLNGKLIFSADATGSAEPIAALKDCAASGHL